MNSSVSLLNSRSGESADFRCLQRKHPSLFCGIVCFKNSLKLLQGLSSKSGGWWPMEYVFIPRSSSAGPKR